jgi:uncharacterized protein YeaO (DUF488 family)
MPVRTKSYNDPINDKEDGERYLIMRYWARPKSKKQLHIVDWLRDLAPSKELHRDWYPKDKNKKRISKEEYITRLNNEIIKNQNALRLLAMLRDKAIDNDNSSKENNKKIITLLCIEKEAVGCLMEKQGLFLELEQIGIAAIWVTSPFD